VRRRLKKLYGDKHDIERMEERLFRMVGRYGVGGTAETGAIISHQDVERWDETDAVLITYADMVQKQGERPLQTLRGFCQENLRGAFKVVHLLPFFPWSSDDGFSVIDYREVDPMVGTWADVRRLGEDFGLMFDLVLNHCSSRSEWFRDFVSGIEPATHYFLEMDPRTELGEVVRPRTSPLLTKTRTRDGETHVWTTFSADQVDLNWQNPDVLFEFLDILFLYLSQGMRICRMDAVAFLWKELGTGCIHLPQTHEMVKLFRDVIDMVQPEAVILTETNVPHRENVSYFGAGDEAHMVYNFTLPPLLLHGLLRQDASTLTKWAQELGEAPRHCTFFNFTASHDGIGMRPLQDILDEEEIEWLVKQTQERGGRVSYRALADGSKKPYELNITYFDALSEPGEEALSIERFLCSQALALSLRGVPGVYFHSLVATPNYEEGVEETGQNRTINRRKYEEETLAGLLGSRDGRQARVFRRYTRMLKHRARREAFHPDGAQLVHNGGKNLFIVQRTSLDGKDVVLCVFNFTAKEQVIRNPQNTPLLQNATSFYDILSGKTLSSGKKGLTLQPYQAVWLTPGNGGGKPARGAKKQGARRAGRAKP